MSADNTIVILHTKNPEDNSHVPFHYRVKEIQAAENLYYDAPPNSFNTEYVIEVFGDCAIFTDEAEAYREALRLEKEIKDEGYIVEYGVVRENFSHLCFPEKKEVAS